MKKALTLGVRGADAMRAWYEETRARLPFPHECRTVPTRFGKTHMLAAGREQGRPLVLVQGMGGNAMLWEPLLESLVRRHRVYALDVIGQMGKSDPVWLSYRDDSFSEWIEDVLDALGIDSADLAGMSFGARLVLRFAGYAPQRVNRLALLSPIEISGIRWSIVRRVFPLGINLWKPSDEKMRKFALALFGVQGRAMDGRCAEAMFLILKHYRPVKGWKQTLDGLSLFPPLPASELRRVRAPVLVLEGAHEQLCDPQAVVKRSRELLANLAAAEIVPAAGHLLQYDNPARVNAGLMEFFSEAPG
ncbi:MAG: alpha/beta fold hydrolase [Anaerolineales bacterium]|nr:alpha/beta fold hydrolase [Anaerolineales bacterium]